MADYVKRFVKKDGSQRVTIYGEDYAVNPRNTTDEPLHCEDWSREFSIMNKQEREIRYASACEWIRYMLERYGNTKAIFEVLRENASKSEHNEGDNALVYDKGRREWIIYYWNERWTDSYGEIHGNCWSEEASFCCKLKDITAWNVVSYLSDEQIEVFADEKYFTDGIKMMSYRLGYCGEITFSEGVNTESEGICWLEKDEFIKYSGCDEDYWKSKSLKEIEFLIEELIAWSRNEVYGFELEECIKSKIHKEYTNIDKEAEDYEEEEWKEVDSCWGFYGKLDKILEYMLSEAMEDMSDFEEE